MAKIKSVWFCSDCGAESSKWAGRCPSCGAWNTMVEEKVKSRGNDGLKRRADAVKPQLMSEVEATAEERIKMPSRELNRVLGGGLVAGSLVLIGGEPGIGKSTLVLQNIL